MVPIPGTGNTQAKSRSEQVSPQNPEKENPETSGATNIVSKPKHLGADTVGLLLRTDRFHMEFAMCGHLKISVPACS